jgi:poly(hydroxyalkanoate) depolymerase family esterase
VQHGCPSCYGRSDPARRKIIRGLHDTITRLASRKRTFAATRSTEPQGSEGKLTPLRAFGSNPGALKAWIYVPSSYVAGGALVVVLHGCTQTASGYDHGTGWSRLADEQGFMLLFPEQQRSNNPNLCFNWFSPEDASRGSGEALSIRQMINAVQMQHGTDPSRIYVTGLSAGGAMAAVMLATYPDIFAGGAVIAGLPYGTARTVPEAFDRMRGHGSPSNAVLTDLVRSASGHRGPWPTLSVWHGTADSTVDDGNAAALVEQWRRLHGAKEQPSAEELVDGYPRRTWQDSGGKLVIEEYRITGLGHGTPLDASGTNSGETAGPFLLDAGISSTRRIAQFWGVAPKVKTSANQERTVSRRPDAAIAEPLRVPQPAAAASGIGKTIEDALRSAGLMR